MASRFQAVHLVAAPSYPNAIAWSDENLIAVACGQLVTILNPALPFGPRGLIKIPTIEPFPIGVIESKDLFSGCLLPTCLSRDQPCVRSISWSPLGLAPNAGCLLAVCTTEGCVKLYRPPFCDFNTEWIEVSDISDMLYNYLASIHFEESDVPCSKYSDVQAAEHGRLDDLPQCVSRKEMKRRQANAPSLRLCSNSEDIARSSPLSDFEVSERNSKQIVCVSRSQEKPIRQLQGNSTVPLVTANQYASRSMMLSSVVVAWSPMLQLSPKTMPVPLSGQAVSLLAVGGKSGKVSLWKIYVPEHYSIEDSMVPTTVLLVGLFQAHKSWISSISWALLDSDSSNPKVLLATGSSDGSVRIWLGYSEDVLASSETNFASFSLLKEVITVDAVPVTVLSLIVPSHSPDKILLAIGKGSIAFEVWICDITNGNFAKAGSHDTHDHLVTDLAWAFDGRCLYSCSKDNVVRSWILDQSSLREVPMPSNIPGLGSSNNLPDAFLSCFGLALSPGNLMLATVRSFDTDLLNPMYEARTLKAAVEFYWIGGQQIDAMSNSSSDFNTEAVTTFSGKELNHWESNILWSLRKCENLDKPLVVWDIVAALLAFKESISKFVEGVLVRWLDTSCAGFHLNLSSDEDLLDVSRRLSKITTRQLNLLNIICRRGLLSKLKPDQINQKMQGTEVEPFTMWTELLLSSERELRKRLVGLSFSAFITFYKSDTTHRPGYWYPVGLGQMEQWVALNHDYVQNSLKILASELGERQTRLQSTAPGAAEQCSYCSASVPFESPEFAFCQGKECDQGFGQSHKLARCAVSMQVLPTSPLWFCTCCHRWVFRLAPAGLFAMAEYTLHFKFSAATPDLELFSKPLCPFCGILLQRRQPDFLLSASPV